MLPCAALYHTWNPNFERFTTQQELHTRTRHPTSRHARLSATCRQSPSVHLAAGSGRHACRSCLGLTAAVGRARLGSTALLSVSLSPGRHLPNTGTPVHESKGVFSVLKSAGVRETDLAAPAAVSHTPAALTQRPL